MDREYGEAGRCRTRRNQLILSAVHIVSVTSLARYHEWFSYVKRQCSEQNGANTITRSVIRDSLNSQSSFMSALWITSCTNAHRCDSFSPKTYLVCVLRSFQFFRGSFNFSFPRAHFLLGLLADHRGVVHKCLSDCRKLWSNFFREQRLVIAEKTNSSYTMTR